VGLDFLAARETAGRLKLFRTLSSLDDFRLMRFGWQQQNRRNAFRLKRLKKKYKG
jgi:hypothetical protein